MTDDGPVFPAAPPARIDLPEGLALMASDPSTARAVAKAVNESREHLSPWMAWAREPATEEALADFMTEAVRNRTARRDFGYTIIDAATGAVVGGCGLHGRVGPDGLEIGYWVHVDWIGRGVATAVASALTDAAFGVEGIERVRISCAVDNVRSARVPEKLGFRRVEVVVPDEGISEGRPTQRWDLTRIEWQSRKDP